MEGFFCLGEKKRGLLVKIFVFWKLLLISVSNLKVNSSWFWDPKLPKKGDFELNLGKKKKPLGKSFWLFKDHIKINGKHFSFVFFKKTEGGFGVFQFYFAHFQKFFVGQSGRNITFYFQPKGVIIGFGFGIKKKKKPTSKREKNLGGKLFIWAGFA